MASPPPPETSAQDSLAAASEQSLVVTSDEIVTSLVFSCIGGLLFLGLWVLARRPLRHVFHKRTVRRFLARCCARHALWGAVQCNACPVAAPHPLLSSHPHAAHLMAPAGCRPGLQQLTDVPARPPPLGLRGWVPLLFSYLGPVFYMTDGEFAETVGLDGLVSWAQRAQRGAWECDMDSGRSSRHWRVGGAGHVACRASTQLSR